MSILLKQKSWIKVFTTLVFVLTLVSGNSFAFKLSGLKNSEHIPPKYHKVFEGVFTRSPELSGAFGLLPRERVEQITREIDAGKKSEAEITKLVEEQIAVHKRDIELRMNQESEVTDAERAAATEYLLAADEAALKHDGIKSYYESLAPPKAAEYDVELASQRASEAEEALTTRLKEEGNFSQMAFESSKKAVVDAFFGEGKQFDDLEPSQKLAVIRLLEMYGEQGVDVASIAKQISDQPTLNLLLKGEGENGRAADPDAVEGFFSLSKFHEKSLLKQMLSDGKLSPEEARSLISKLKEDASLPADHKAQLDKIATQYDDAYAKSQSKNAAVRALGKFQMNMLQRRLAQSENLHELYKSMKEAGQEEEIKRLRDELCNCPGMAACPA